MGALDALNYEKHRAAIPTPKESLAISLNLAEQQVIKDTAALDKINANPNASVKQITTALNRLNRSTDIHIKSLMNYLDAPSGGSSDPSGGSSPGGGDSPGGGTPLNTALLDSPTPTPPTPPVVPEVKVVIPVKTAPIDTLLIDQDTINPDLMTDLIFENIGGQELINIARNDTINGQTVSYQPIKNLTSIQQQYNPNNILSLQDTSDKYFINFPIKLETHLLEEGEGDGPSGAYVYIETETGDLIVELVNLENDQQLEVEISQSGTIYEAEFNES